MKKCVSILIGVLAVIAAAAAVAGPMAFSATSASADDDRGRGRDPATHRPAVVALDGDVVQLTDLAHLTRRVGVDRPRDAQLGVRWNIVGRTRAHASFVHRKDDNNVDIGTANGLTLGVTHGLSARTDVYVLASHVKNKKSVSIPYPVSWSANPQAGQSPTGIAFGIRHAF